MMKVLSKEEWEESVKRVNASRRKETKQAEEQRRRLFEEEKEE